MVIVLSDNNSAILGSIICDITTNPEIAEFKMLSVLGDYHGKGYGSVLLNAAEERVKLHSKC